MRLLQVISSTNPAGGGPIESILQLSPALGEIGVNVEIASCDPPNAPWLGTSAMPIHALGPGVSGYYYTNRLQPWLRSNAACYDAVIVNGIWQYHSFATWRAIRRTDVPYFVFTHGMLDPWFKWRYPLKHVKKWMYWPWADYRVLSDATAVIFTSEEERTASRESFWLYRANEAVAGYGIATPPNTYLTSTQHLSSEFPDLADKRVVLFLGRMHEVKGCELLLEAFSMVSRDHPRLHLMMAGPDQKGWVGSLKKTASRLGLDSRVSWPGMLQGDAKWSAIRRAEVLCLPSHHENFGFVVVEALACGKPVLISDKVNIWRDIEADGAGFISDDTTEGTVRNLRDWLALESDSYQQMSMRATQCFAARFHVRTAARRLVTIIEENTR